MAFKNPILNFIWQFFPDFILWKLWKEYNQIIFYSLQLSWGDIWSKIQYYILETVILSKWSEYDLKCDMRENPIFQKWDLCLAPSPDLHSTHLTSVNNPINWKKPPLVFFKINFYGASKGNMGPVGFFVVFRDHQGLILNIIVGNMGHDTNNIVNLWDLIRGIQETTSLGYHKIIVESDS
jgi:hypothetical protein